MQNKEDRKQRIEQLKRKIKPETRVNSLLEECLIALGDGVRIYSQEESKRLFKVLDQTFLFTSWGRIDWRRLENKQQIESVQDIFAVIKENQGCVEDNYLVFWDNAECAVIETSLDKVVSNWDEVISVSFDTWIVNLEQQIIIEHYHEGEIIVGFMKRY